MASLAASLSSPRIILHAVRESPIKAYISRVMKAVMRNSTVGTPDNPLANVKDER
jgi:hypothetical protein